MAAILSRPQCFNTGCYYTIENTLAFTSIEVKTWMNNYIDVKLLDVITHLYPNFSNSLVLSPFWSSCIDKQFTLSIKMEVITYPCTNLTWAMSVEGDLGHHWHWVTTPNHITTDTWVMFPGLIFIMYNVFFRNCAMSGLFIGTKIFCIHYVLCSFWETS